MYKSIMKPELPDALNTLSENAENPKSEIDEPLKPEDNSSSSKEKQSKPRKRIKYRISKILSWAVYHLNEFDRKLTAFASNENPDGVESMTATDKADNVKPYIDYLLWAAKEPGITNIALTGPYGSGKSSIIKTFQRLHREFRYLNVSLAKFDAAYKENPNWRDEVEISILQQFFYHVKAKKIPDSRFKRIRKTTVWEKIIGTVFLVMISLSGYLLYNPGFLKNLPGDWITNQTDYILLGSFGIIIILSSLLVYRFYRNLLKLQIGKFSLDGSIELNKISDTSIFNKHLDEIIYFFNSTPYNIVVIEDIDRINDPDIFVKFREVNFLINNSKEIGREIKFLYALRDGMFKDDERTKFFDFIVPVIPVANATNSVDKLLSKLPDEKVDKVFLQNASLYIDDMRLLINIVNEYLLYKKMIGAKLDQRKLLAMIIYKNLNPEEFEKLHEHGNGEINRLFTMKSTFVKTALSELDKKINETTDEIGRLEGLIPANLEQLRMLYIYKIFEKLPTNHSPNISLLSNIDTEELIEQVRSSKTIQSRVLVGYSYQINDIKIDWSKIEKEINPDYSYDELVKRIGNDIDSTINILKDRLQKLRDKRDRLFKMNLKALIDADLAFEFPEEYQANRLLVYLVKNGHIDESYPNYISYFYEGKLTLNDREFILSILNGPPLPKNAQVPNPAIVYESLHLDNFGNPAILNIAFYNWLKANPKRHSTELDRIKELLVKNHDHAFDFIEACLSVPDTITFLLESVIPEWPGYWIYLTEEKKLDDQNLSKHFMLLLKHLKADIIKPLNKEDALGEYMASSIELYKMEDLRMIQSKFLELADQVEFKLIRFNYDENLSQLYKGIYERHQYRLDANNIKAVLLAFGGELEDLELDFSLANYTVIRKSKADYLKAYISKHIAEYVERMITGIESNNEESSESFTDLLSYPNEELPLQTKLEIIEQQTNKIKDIAEVTDDTWAALFANNKVLSNWSNILGFMQQGATMPKELVTFLNKHPENIEQLEALQSEPTFPFEDQTILAVHLIFAENGFTDEAYAALLKKVAFKLDGVDLSGASSGKLGELVNQNKLSFNQWSLESLQSMSVDLLVTFIVKNYADFENSEGIVWLNPDSLAALIRKGNINSDQKLVVIGKIDSGTIERSPGLADSIRDFFNDNLGFIVQEKAELLRKVFSSSTDSAGKARFLANLLPLLSQDELKTLLSQLGEKFEAIVSGDKQVVKFSNDEENRYLFDKLVPYELFSSKSSDDEEIRINLFRKKKEE